MSFSDLPSEVLNLILSQNCLTDSDVVPFLYYRRTYHAARHRLMTNRNILIKCQNKLVLLESQYAFGVYGLVSSDQSSVLVCNLRECVAALDSNVLFMVNQSRSITINICFTDSNTASILDDLCMLIARFDGQHKNLLLQVSLNYWNPAWSEDILEVLVKVTARPNVTATLQLHTPMWYFPFYARAASLMRLYCLNVQCAGSEPQLDDSVPIEINHVLQKLKIECRFLVPHLSFHKLPGILSHLELDLPTLQNAEWLQNSQIVQFSNLEDLRIFHLDGISCLHAMFRYECLPKLKLLYLSFDEGVVNVGDFNFERLAPNLELLYLSDKKTTSTIKHPFAKK